MAEAFYNFDEDDASSSAEDSECEEVELVEELVQDHGMWKVSTR